MASAGECVDVGEWLLMCSTCFSSECVVVGEWLLMCSTCFSGEGRRVCSRGRMVVNVFHLFQWRVQASV